MKSYTKIIYVAGKFQNDLKNKNFIESNCIKFREKYPDYLFINGVSQFSYFYNITDTYEGTSMCLELMKKCADEVWVVGDYSDSVGTNIEIFVAEENKIPVSYVKGE